MCFTEKTANKTQEYSTWLQYSIVQFQLPNHRGDAVFVGYFDLTSDTSWQYNWFAWKWDQQLPSDLIFRQTFSVHFFLRGTKCHHHELSGMYFTMLRKLIEIECSPITIVRVMKSWTGRHIDDTRIDIYLFQYGLLKVTRKSSCYMFM